jgi:uncharacterized protein
MSHRLTTELIRSESELIELIGSPTPLVCRKISTQLHESTKPFIVLSPFVCIATASIDGGCDVSPRGDAAGFVRILDDKTLLLPERPGNRLADSLRNIVRNPKIGMLFFIPGVGDTFRVNGNAWITTDASLLAQSVAEGKTPKLGILVDIEEAFLQCSKAFLRSDLWNAAHVNRDSLPSSGEILREIIGEDFDADSYDAERAARYLRRENFY